jgi:hypothetical protein
MTGLPPFIEYLVANHRLGNPRFELLYVYEAANPLTYTDPDGRVAPLVCAVPPALAALGKALAATAGILAGVAAGEAASDWLNDRKKDCNDCDDEPPNRCDELLKNDQATCGFWGARRNARNYQACMGSAMARYADCLRGIFPPRIPLSPSPFGRN